MLLALLLLCAGVEASIDLLKRDATPSDIVAATRGLIHRRLGARFNDQVWPEDPMDEYLLYS